MPRWIISQVLYGKPDDRGRQSHDNLVTMPDGREHFQTFFADPVKTLARLRANLARQFWHDRSRRNSSTLQ